MLGSAAVHGSVCQSCVAVRTIDATFAATIRSAPALATPHTASIRVCTHDRRRIRQSNQRNDCKRQLQAKSDLTTDEKRHHSGITYKCQDDDCGHDCEAARDDPAHRRMEAHPNESFHDDLSRQAAADRRTLPGTQKAHRKQHGSHTGSEHGREQSMCVPQVGDDQPPPRSNRS
jgi:hypothetical protein